MDFSALGNFLLGNQSQPGMPGQPPTPSPQQSAGVLQLLQQMLQGGAGTVDPMQAQLQALLRQGGMQSAPPGSSPAPGGAMAPPGGMRPPLQMPMGGGGPRPPMPLGPPSMQGPPTAGPSMRPPGMPPPAPGGAPGGMNPAMMALLLQQAGGTGGTARGAMPPPFGGLLG